MDVTIYGLFDPRNGELRYVGRTIRRLAVRLGSHLAQARTRDTRHPLRAWIRRLKADGLRPEIEEIESVPQDDWQEAERFWIAYFRGLGARLTNQSLGGDRGTLGFKMSPEAVDGIRARNLGNTWGSLTKGLPRKPTSEATRQRISASLRGLKRTPEARVNMSAAQKGRTFTDEARAKIALSLTGRSPSPETRAKLSAVGRGVPKPEGHGAKVSAAKRGKPLSLQHIERLKEAWARRKARIGA